jgi:hypothetical protein
MVIGHKQENVFVLSARIVLATSGPLRYTRPLYATHMFLEKAQAMRP